MPAARAATVRESDLPDVCTASELAAFERVDVRTLRAELKAGNVPGAYMRGRQFRIVTRAYLDALAKTPAEVPHADE
jgi:hypothetical protein